MSDETMKFGRISDENLAAASKYSSAEDIDIRRMADEVRHWRALFSPERVEALDKLRHDIFRCSDYFVEADWYEQARDVLDRLLANGGAK